MTIFTRSNPTPMAGFYPTRKTVVSGLGSWNKTRSKFRSGASFSETHPEPGPDLTHLKAKLPKKPIYINLISLTLISLHSPQPPPFSLHSLHPLSFHSRAINSLPPIASPLPLTLLTHSHPLSSLTLTHSHYQLSGSVTTSPIVIGSFLPFFF